MSSNLVVKKLKDEIGKDLKEKIILFPKLPYILIYKMFQGFTALGRPEVFGKSGTDTLGQVSGGTYRKSFRLKMIRNNRFAVGRITNNMASLWEGSSKTGKQRIPFFSRMVKFYRKGRISEKIIEGVLADIAKGNGNNYK